MTCSGYATSVAPSAAARAPERDGAIDVRRHRADGGVDVAKATADEPHVDDSFISSSTCATRPSEATSGHGAAAVSSARSGAGSASICARA